MNSALLDERIKNFRYTKKDVAVAMNMSRPALKRKLSGEVELKRSEIVKLIALLQMTPDDARQIFFNDAIFCGSNVYTTETREE